MIHMVNSTFKLPPGTTDIMDDCRDLIRTLVNEYASLAAMHQHDPATATLVYREAQRLKNLMCDSFILPHGPGTFIPAAEPEVRKRKCIAAAPAAAPTPEMVEATVTATQGDA